MKKALSILRNTLVVLILNFLSVGCGESPTLEELFPEKNIGAQKPLSRTVFENSVTVVEQKLEQVLGFPRCKVFDFAMTLSYPGVDVETFTIKGRMVTPRSSSQANPVVITFPPAGGATVVERDVAEALCETGMTTFITESDIAGIDQRVLPEPADLNQSMVKAVAYVKGVHQWAQGREDLDATKFGVFGASLGGILSAFTMSVVPQVRAGYIAVAGANLPEILANSNQEQVLKLRKYHMGQYQLATPLEYQLFMEATLDYDILDFAENIDPSRIFMVTSRKDTKVPTKNQNELWEAFGRPVRSVWRFGHFWTIVGALTGEHNHDKITQFYREKFRE